MNGVSRTVLAAPIPTVTSRPTIKKYAGAGNLTDMTINTTLGRRAFLATAAKASIAAATTTVGIQNSAVAAVSEKKLRFWNTHTRESIDAVFFRNGNYEANELNKLKHFLRDHRENEWIDMDVGLYEQLWDLQQIIGGQEIFEVISGYRSPKTNRKLRKNTSGVAKKSFHMKGRAIDVRLRGTKISDLQQAALTMKAGGLGYYPSSRFIHLDTGPVRSWS